LKNNDRHTFLINHKLTPLFITKEGKIWKSFCLVSLSENHTSGNVKIYKQNENKFWRYNLDGDFWETGENINLSDREREILYLSIQGLTVNDIAKQIFVSEDTVKFHRHKLFEKLDVTNITEAISFVVNNRLL
jgi:DNA-binding NarL/FixJ family response regulator